MTMHLIVCPHCGKQMKTKVLVRGTIRCPGCQVRFKAPEPHQGVATIRQDEAKHDLGYILSFTFFGLVFVFSFFATGALQALDRFWTDNVMTPLIFAPFYAAQLCFALYFFTPLIYWLFDREPKAKSNPSTQQISVVLGSSSAPGLPNQVNHRRGVMGTLGILGLIFTTIGLVFIGAIGIFLYALLGGF